MQRTEWKKRCCCHWGTLGPIAAARSERVNSPAADGVWGRPALDARKADAADLLGRIAADALLEVAIKLKENIERNVQKTMQLTGKSSTDEGKCTSKICNRIKIRSTD